MARSVLRLGTGPLVLLGFALVAACAPPDEGVPDEVETLGGALSGSKSKGKPRPDPGPTLPKRGLLVDPNGYPLSTCLRDVTDPQAPRVVGCVRGNVVGGWDLAPGSYQLYSYDSVDVDGGFDLGQVVVDGGGVEVTSNRFTVARSGALTRITAKVAPFGVDSGPYPGRYSFGDPAKMWTGSFDTKLIANRIYSLLEYQGVSVDADLGHGFARFDIRINPLGTAATVGPDTLRSFSWDPAAARVRAQPVAVTVDFAGYSGRVGFGEIWKSGPRATFWLLPARSYPMIDKDSGDPSTSMQPFPTGAAVSVGHAGVDRGVVHPGPDTGRFFTVDGPGRQFRAIVGTVRVSAAHSAICLGNQQCTAGDDSVTALPLLLGRNYGVGGEDDQPVGQFTLDAAGLCAPGAVIIPHGPAAKRRGGGGGVLRIVECKREAPTRVAIDFAAEATGRDRVQLTWRDPSGGAFAFELQRARDQFFDERKPKRISLPAGTTKYVDRGLNPGKRYTYRLRMVERQGGHDHDDDDDCDDRRGHGHGHHGQAPRSLDFTPLRWATTHDRDCDDDDHHHHHGHDHDHDD